MKRFKARRSGRYELRADIPVEGETSPRRLARVRAWLGRAWLAVRYSLVVDFLACVVAPIAAFALIALAAIGLFIGVLVAGVSFLDERSCNQTLESIDRDGRYGFWEGCLVEADNGELVPLDNWRAVEDQAA